MSSVWNRANFCRLVLVCLSVHSAAQAMQPLVTDDTGTQGAGHRQLEWSYERARVLGQDQRSHEQGWVYTLGLTPELDAFVAASHARSAEMQGWGNPVLGAKWRFWATEDEQTTMALKPELAVPVGRGHEAAQLGAGLWSGHLTMVLSQSTNFGAVHLNWGWGADRFRRGSAQADVHCERFSVAPVWGVNDRLSLAMDVGQERATQAGVVTATRFLEWGLVFAVRPDLDWAWGVIRTRKPTERAHALTSGLTWRF